MNDSNGGEFNFDEWAALARADPAEFERRRTAYLGAALQQMEQRVTDPGLRQRLRGLQFRCDMERARAKTALKATLVMSSLMWDAFLELRDRLQSGVHPAPVAEGAAAAATVLPFRQRDGSEAATSDDGPNDPPAVP